jgi:hypothetical protein
MIEKMNLMRFKGFTQNKEKSHQMAALSIKHAQLNRSSNQPSKYELTSTPS